MKRQQLIGLGLSLLCLSFFSPASADTVHFSFQGTAGEGILAQSENPPVPGGGTGGIMSGGVKLDTDTNELSMDFGWGAGNGFTNLSSDVELLNIHGPTPSSGEDAWTESGDVIATLEGYNPAFDSGRFIGTIALTNEQVEELLAGRFYIHFHTKVNGGGEARGYFTVTETEVEPDNVKVTLGMAATGTVEDLRQSDNADFSIRRSSIDVQSRTQFQISSISPVENPTSIEIRLEGSVFARTNVVQSIQLFAYNTNTWVTIDSRNATRFSDSTVTASGSGELARFVAFDLQVLARVTFTSDNPRQQFTSNTDQFVWVIEQ